MIKIGCCGFPVSQKRYYRIFSVVEVQATFYDFVSSENLKKWRKDAPPDFEFILKAFQFITHPPTSPTYKRAKSLTASFSRKDMKLENLGNFKPTEEVFKCYRILTQYAEILGSRIIIFQSPPGFKPVKENERNMEEFFKRIDRRDFIFGWEARGEWKPEEIKRICQRFGLIDVVDPFVRDTTTTVTCATKTDGEGNSRDIFYYRIHGGKGYREKIGEEKLKYLMEKIQGLTARGVKDGYVMFNNISMFEDALRFKERLGSNSVA
jgi:uncharacterized protein YecE (DUF72 family)